MTGTTTPARRLLILAAPPLLAAILVAFAALLSGGCSSKESEKSSPEGTDERLDRQLAKIYPQALDYLITSRLATTSADMAAEALAYRLANLEPDAQTRRRSYYLLGRAHAYRGRFEDAAAAFTAAEGYPGAEELSRAFARLAPGAGPEIDAQDLGAAVRSFYSLTEGRFPALLERARETGGANPLEDAAFAVMADPQKSLDGDPAALLPDFAGEEFCEYDPLSFAFLSRLYARRLEQVAPPEAHGLLRWIFGEGSSWEAKETRDQQEDLIWLVLSTCRGCAPEEESLAAIADHYGSGSSPFQHVVQGYYSLAVDDLEGAWGELHQAVQIVPEISEPRQDITSAVFLDFVWLSYRVRSVNFARRWILGSESLRGSFPYLKIPYFYLTWMQREGLIT